MPAVRYGEIYTIHHFRIQKFNSFISKDVSKNAQKIEYGDILFTISGETAEEIGKCATLTGAKEAWAGSDIVCMAPIMGNSIFLSYLLNSPLLQREKSRLGQGQSVVHIGTEALKSLLIVFPSISEQEKIADCLSSLDELIEATTEKTERLKKYKKGLMQRLFPKEGATKPPLRFPEFQNAPEWEEKKLGELATMGSGGTPLSTQKAYYDGDILWVSIADMTTQGKYITHTEKTLTAKGLAESAAKLYPRGSVLYAMYASIGECSIAKERVTSSQAILGIVVGENLDNIFLYNWLLFIKNSVKSLGQQGTQSNLNARIVRNFRIPVPSFLEQKKIADCLSSLDELIEATGQKAEQLKRYKKGLMQKLFP